MSKKVAIIGAAGTLGSCAAFMIAREGLADEMVLLPGTRENLVRFHQMDLETAITGINEMSIRFGRIVVRAEGAEAVERRFARVPGKHVRVTPYQLGNYMPHYVRQGEFFDGDG